jgi:uncharacterized protein (TIGR04255 family)
LHLKYKTLTLHEEINYTEYMSIPSKITPDHLKDTIVEIRFESAIPLDLLAGTALALLSPLGFVYTPAPDNNISFGVGQNQQISIGLNSPNKSGFYIKDSIRIQFISNIISFNCLVDKYVGWTVYSQAIKEVLNLFVEKGLIKSFNRISVRYISEFDGIDIFQNIKGQISINDTGLGVKDSILRLSKDIDNTKTFVTLTNSVKKVIPTTNQALEVSLIDINVFETLPQNSTIDIFEDKLERVHLLQKQVFFNLISDSFLESLNPEY